MHAAVNVVGLFGVLVFVRDLPRKARRKLSSGKSIWSKNSSLSHLLGRCLHRVVKVLQAITLANADARGVIALKLNR